MNRDEQQCTSYGLGCLHIWAYCRDAHFDLKMPDTIVICVEHRGRQKNMSNSLSTVQYPTNERQYMTEYAALKNTSIHVQNKYLRVQKNYAGTMKKFVMEY